MTFKQALQERAITYAELGRRIHRNTSTIYRYANGKWPIPVGVAKLISFATGIPLSVIQGDRKEA